MPIYSAPLQDTRFILNEVLSIERFAVSPDFGYPGREVADAILEEYARFCETIAFPLNRVGDLEGCRRNTDASVTTPTGFRDAYRQSVEMGWPTLGGPKEYGGQGLPRAISTACNEYLFSANLAFAGYFGLTRAAIDALLAKGSSSQKAMYLPKLVSGEWGGTMNLTEPHCGTDLGLISTRAEPKPDGSFAISGTKIFISSGEHDLAENIIHLVLAKVAGSPDNVRGLSLFVVPKYLVGEHGSIGARNPVTCGSLERKMGFHGNSTCVMNYEGAAGWLVGERDKGLAAMFIMMNTARLEVGLQGLAIAEVAHQNAVEYAKSRRQGRAPGGAAEPAERADTLLVHPDVRKTLMESRAAIQAARALCLWAALQEDLSHHADQQEERDAAGELLSLLTPVIKAGVTDLGYKVATDSQQIFGGHGYIEEYGMEQFVRDGRIPMLYEGTNGIQAMDLVGRKILANEGRALKRLLAAIRADLSVAEIEPATANFGSALETATNDLEAATRWIIDNNPLDPNHGPAGAYSYLMLTSLVAWGWMWLKMASSSVAALRAGRQDRSFYEAKLATARFFAERMLPDTASLRRKVEAGAEAVMALPDAAF